MDFISTDAYISSMKPIELEAMEIAKRMLETSFDIQECNGYISFKKKRIQIIIKVQSIIRMYIAKMQLKSLIQAKQKPIIVKKVARKKKN